MIPQWTKNKNKGYIVESGSNENGYYTKFSNGDLICRRSTTKDAYKTSTSYNVTVQNIKIYRSNVFTWNYPVQFAQVPTLQVCVATGINGSRFCLGRLNGAPSASNVQVQLLALDDFIENGIGYTNLEKVDLIAIGKWK